MVPAELKYTKEHEWVKVEGTRARMGVTDHAQQQLGDIVFVELPAIGQAVAQLKACGVVESVKAVSDLFAPLSGSVVERNAELEAHPDLVNKDPYGAGWMVVLEMANAAELGQLMDAAAYEAYVAQEGGH